MNESSNCFSSHSLHENYICQQMIWLGFFLPTYNALDLWEEINLDVAGMEPLPAAWQASALSITPWPCVSGLVHKVWRQRQNVKKFANVECLWHLLVRQVGLSVAWADGDGLSGGRHDRVLVVASDVRFDGESCLLAACRKSRLNWETLFFY